MNEVHTLPAYQRPYYALLLRRLQEPRRFLQVVAGPRQVGKTTLVRQVLAVWPGSVVYASADEPTLKGPAWVATQWERARAHLAAAEEVVLVLDEVQKAIGWAESVKRLWDEDTRAGRPVKVVLLGSAPLLMQQGLSESLAGRFEVLYLPHWSYAEMRDAFGYTLEDYLYYGGYPGAAVLRGEPLRFMRYVRDSLIETTLSRDVLLLRRIEKPALLRRLFELGCHYSGQVLSYTKMLGQLQEVGNTTTLAHYLELLEAAGLLVGLFKYAGQVHRRRSSSPKWLVPNTALLTAVIGLTPEEVQAEPSWQGRLVETAVGAHLVNGAWEGGYQVYYWRERQYEVDFVVQAGRTLTAIEVKSGRHSERRSGLEAFRQRFCPDRVLVVGTGGVPLEEFLERSPLVWVGRR
ncbi:MAG: ATP-binding protein [Rhodothermus sp.]|nr:ATP-binding protein [Rhodothermus sp.]